jgi:hypothetical protein
MFFFLGGGILSEPHVYCKEINLIYIL